MTQLVIETIKGKGIEKYFEELGNIRIKVFREWPYIYDGDLEYEMDYLKSYANDPDSLCLLIKSGNDIVGMSTLMPLKNEHDDLKMPVAEYGFNVNDFFYYGETCLLESFRGQGIYREVFQKREEHVRSFGDLYKSVCFCSVLRPDNHPLKPKNFRPLDETWKKYGFQRIDDLKMTFSWKDLDGEKETKKELVVWKKDLD